MYKTPEGKRLWDKYGNSKTDDIYIGSKNFGANSSTVAATMSDIRSKGLVKLSTERITIASTPSHLKDLDEFNDVDVSQSKGRKIHLVSLNENFFKEDSSEKGYSTTINVRGKSRSVEYDKYDLAEAVYHEIKAHIEDGVGTGAEQDHTNYGSTYFRLERKRTPGSPAEVIKNQLVKLREDEKKQNNEIGSH